MDAVWRFFRGDYLPTPFGDMRYQALEGGRFAGNCSSSKAMKLRLAR